MKDFLFNILCFLAVLLPFQFALNIAPGFDLAISRVIILILLIFVVLKSLFKRDFFIPINLQSVFLLAFLAINAFSLFIAANFEFGMRKFLFLVSIIPLYFIVQNILKNKSTDQVVMFLKYLVAGGFASFLAGFAIFLSQFFVGIDGLFGFYQKIGPFFWGKSFSASVLSNQSFLVNAGGDDFFRMAALFPDPHNFALFAGTITFLSFSLALFYLKENISLNYKMSDVRLFQATNRAVFNNTARMGVKDITTQMAFCNLKNKNIFIYGFISMFGIISILLSFSRGSYLALAMAILFIVLILLINNYQPEMNLVEFKKIKNRLRNKFGIMAVSVILLLALVFLIFSPAKDRFSSIFSGDDGSIAGRVELLKRGLSISKENLLFGVGIGSAPVYYNEDIDYRNPTNSHNNYLEIIIENGILGLIVWIALIFGTIAQLLRFKNNGNFRLISVGLAGALLFFAISSFFEVFLYSPINLAMLMILLGLSSVIINNQQSAVKY